jgi:hypothetical protein
MQGETRRQSAGGLAVQICSGARSVYEGPGGRHAYHSRARPRRTQMSQPFSRCGLLLRGSDPDYTDWSVGTSGSTPHNSLLIVPSVISIKSVNVIWTCRDFVGSNHGNGRHAVSPVRWALLSDPSARVLQTGWWGGQSQLLLYR